MANLKLITTETFGDLSCNFYRNTNDDILLTREQIGRALEYVYPDDALSKIHRRHHDRLDPFSVVANLASTDGKVYNTTLYSERGVMEICRWSNKPKANLFMDWVWDIVEKYRNNELISVKDFKELINTVNNLTNVVSQLTTSVSDITTTIVTMQQEIKDIKTEMKTALPYNKKKVSYWTRKMFPKYNLLTEHFNITNTELYKNLYHEMQNTYPDVDLNQLQEDYCYENKLNGCYTLDAIEHTPKIRILFESIVDNILDQHGLSLSDPTETKYKTIFDKAS